MGGLGHYLERDGLATASISLIRLHTETIRPPRALWVPFELGRPLGPPNDKAFQLRVLRALIALLDAKTGPVLVDYPEEMPIRDAEDMTGLVCQIEVASTASGEATLADQLRHELVQLKPWYELGRERRGRTTYGNTGLGIDQVADFLCRWQLAAPTTSPVPNQIPVATLKLAVEDIKAFYLEAAQAQPQPAGHRALYHWLWTETALARMLVKVRDVCVSSSDAAIVNMGVNYMVPREHWALYGIDGRTKSAAAR